MKKDYLENSFWNSILCINERLDTMPLLFSAEAIEETLSKNYLDLNDLPVLLSIHKEKHLEILLEKARDITIQRFGQKIDLYAPLYVSNYCNNKCIYCGFSYTNNEHRIKLSHKEIYKECNYLKEIGLHHILIVSGEDDNIVDFDSFKNILKILVDQFDFIGYEIQPLNTKEYNNLYQAGLDGVTVYQETYIPEFYKKYHKRGNKKDYRYRIETPERIAGANIPNITIGALLGLAPYKKDIFFLAQHLKYLINKYWTTYFSVSFPRINNENIDFKIPYKVSDFDYIKIIAGMRVIFPDTPIYLSTRENSFIRDNLVNYGVTNISVESKTEPGGYTLNPETIGQFRTEDRRTMKEIVKMLISSNLRPVVKDWDKRYRYYKQEKYRN